MKYGLTVISISLIISIIIGAVFLYPKYREFSGLRKQISQKEEELANQQNYLKLLRETNEKAEENRDLIDRVASAIPDEPDIPSFLNFLNKEAANTGVGLEDVNWSEPSASAEQRKQTNEYSVSIQISGSYPAFRNFVSALENSARLVEVSGTDFSLEQGVDEAAVFGLKLIIHSY